MPRRPHPFAAPAAKARARAVPKPLSPFTAMLVSPPAVRALTHRRGSCAAAGAAKVFREVASGAKTDRPQLARLVSELAAGDVVMVTRLDRLARSSRDLLNTLAAITEKKVGFRSLGDAWADTTTAHGRLMLTVLGGLAEFERELIRIRTGEGRARAKENGISLGRKPKLTPHQKQEAIRRRDHGEAVREIARTYNVSPSTISRLTS
jgi:DNA invertase Pin-like site-specific DNA recombinase